MRDVEGLLKCTDFSVFRLSPKIKDLWFKVVRTEILAWPIYKSLLLSLLQSEMFGGFGVMNNFSIVL